MYIDFLSDDARSKAAARALDCDHHARSGVILSPNEPPPDVLVLPIPPTRDGIHPTGMPDLTLTELGRLLTERAPNALLIGYGPCPAALEHMAYDDLEAHRSFINRNATLTAEGGMTMILDELRARGGYSLSEMVIVILGFGRIARSIATCLAGFGCRILVGARRTAARAAADAKGYFSFDITDKSFFDERGELLFADRLHILINTVPSSDVIETAVRMPNALFGIELSGKPHVLASCMKLPYPVLDGRSLPTRYTPEAAGIALAAAIRHSLKDRMSIN